MDRRRAGRARLRLTARGVARRRALAALGPGHLQPPHNARRIAAPGGVRQPTSGQVPLGDDCRLLRRRTYPMTTTLFEQLESRQMMSATLVNGIVQVMGTGGNDVISIDQTTQSLRVTINGVTQSFPRSGVSGISVDAMGGADLVRLTP